MTTVFAYFWIRSVVTSYHPYKVAVAALYNSTTDLALCHTCVTAMNVKMKIAGNVNDSAFIHNVFCNWKDRTRCFSGHENSATHKTSVDSEVVIKLPKTTGDVGEMLSSTLPAQSTPVNYDTTLLLLLKPPCS